MSESDRPLSDAECALVLKLLSISFPGRDQLREQLNVVRALPATVEGVLPLQVNSTLRANVMSRIPTEGRCLDEDGVMIHVLLHVTDGKMNEIETYKDDGSAIRRPPSPEALELFTPYGEAGVG